MAKTKYVTLNKKNTTKHSGLTLEKKYEVLAESSNLYLIRNDWGILKGYSKEKFKEINEKI